MATKKKDDFLGFRAIFIGKAKEKIEYEAEFDDKGDDLKVSLKNTGKEELDSMNIVINMPKQFDKYKEGCSINYLVRTAVVDMVKAQKTMHERLNSWEKAKEYVFPVLREEAPMLDEDIEVNFPSKENAPQLPLSLKIFYMIDCGKHMMYVMDKYMDNWDIDVEILHAYSIKNLSKLSKPKKVNIKEMNLTTYESRTNDGFDAARILILDLNKYKKEFKKDVLISIPTRDSLYIVPTTKDMMLGLPTMTKDNYNKSSYPVSPHVYLWDGEKLHQVIINDLLNDVSINNSTYH